MYIYVHIYDKGTQPRIGFPNLNAAAVVSYDVISTRFVLSVVACFAVSVVCFVCVGLGSGFKKQPLLAQAVQ